MSTAHPRTPGDSTPAAAEATALRELLGSLLRQAREQAGYSQAQLTERAGTNRRTIERLELGQRRPTPSMLAALAHALTTDHDAADDLAARLAAATGASLRVDSPAGIGRRMRRTQQATRWHLQQLQAADVGVTLSRPSRRSLAAAQASPRGVTEWMASAGLDRHGRRGGSSGVGRL